MANWNLPTITSDYINFVTEMNDKIADAGTMNFGAPTNLPEHAMRFNRSINAFEEWESGIWNAKVIGIASGGTGATTAAQARTNLGIGSMGTQNSNAVNITGGSITGVIFDAGNITSGIVPLARGGTGSSLAIGGYGVPLMSDGVRVGFFDGVNIATLNASNLTAGTVPAARLSGVAFLATQNVFTGVNFFDSNLVSRAPGDITSYLVQTGNPQVSTYNTLGPVNQKYWRWYYANGGLYLQKLNDDFGWGGQVLNITTEGYIIGYGGSLTNLNASAITAGRVAQPYLGGGGYNTDTFLRGDGNWAVPPPTSPGESIPSGLIAIFDTGCPAGWTRVASLDGRFPLGSNGWGSQGGRTDHTHSFSVNSTDAGGHDHGVNVSGSGSVNGQTSDSGASNFFFQAGPNQSNTPGNHHHDFNANFNINSSGNTNYVNGHTHQVYGNTSSYDGYPPYMTVVYCRKN